MDNIEKEKNDMDINNKEDAIIEKWKKLQEIILEEKTLIDVLFNYKSNDYTDIKKLIIDYSETKLKLRKINDENQKKRKKKEKKLQIEPKINDFNNSHISIYKKIEKLLFFLRENIDYIIKIILSINDINDINDEPKIESLVDLIVNHFYDNLPPKNIKHRQIMIIIYMLLEHEICQMDCAMHDNFLNQNIFLDKLLNSFCKKEEFTKYLSKLLNPLVLSIEKEVEKSDIMNLSLLEINEFINKNNISDKQEMRSFSLNENNRTAIKNNYKRNYTIIKDKNILINQLTKSIWKSCNEFIDDLTHEKLYHMIKEEKNIYNKELYILQYERSFNFSNGDKNIFSNNKFFESLNNDCFNDNIEAIMNKYKKNYLFIHQKIDMFLLGLINDIKIIPINIRYICKIIYILISKKFPNLPKYLKNSFIGSFFFDHFIFPGLVMENSLAFENKIISFEAKKCLGEIICLLSHANKCLLFNNNDDIEKSIYNNYLLQIIPILDKFYNGLIDIKLPKIFDKLINLKLKEHELKSHKHRKKLSIIKTPVN
jgi:hypothetical protein